MEGRSFVSRRLTSTSQFLRRFVFLGSSARRLKTANTNLLAGRAAVRTMSPLAPVELGTDFTLERVLRFGSIPPVWQADDPKSTLDAYTQLYVREQIRARGGCALGSLPRILPGPGRLGERQRLPDRCELCRHARRSADCLSIELGE